MGLMDILNGMQNGPRGQRNASSGGGMSPITMAILGLLAYKAIKSFSGGQAPAGQANAGGTPSIGGGGIGDLLSGGLGGLLAGGAAGSVLSGGLNDLLNQFQRQGQGDAANSWVGRGENKTISADDLGRALGGDQIDALIAQTGLSRQDLLEGLSQYLPQVIDKLTPDGRLPTDEEAGRMI